MLMLVEELQPLMEAQPTGYGSPATFYLTINKTTMRNTWSAGYQDFNTGLILLAVNGCDTLDEVALRLDGRLQRYFRMHAPKPRILQNARKDDMVRSANVMEDKIMSDSSKELTHGQKLVGINFNPAADPNVQRLKELAAETIDLLEKIHGDRLTASANSTADYDTNTVHGEAIRRVMDAQMWTVKDATWQPSNVPGSADRSAGKSSLPEAADDGRTDDPLNQHADTDTGTTGEDPGTGAAGTDNPTPPAQ